MSDRPIVDMREEIRKSQQNQIALQDVQDTAQDQQSELEVNQQSQSFGTDICSDEIEAEIEAYNEENLVEEYERQRNKKPSKSQRSGEAREGKKRAS